MDDNTKQDDQVPVQDDQTADDGSVLDTLKNAIPGNKDDQLLDSASDALSAAGDKASEWTDKATAAVPGEFDDKLVEGVQSAADKAGDVAGDMVDRLKDLNPFDKSDEQDQQ